MTTTDEQILEMVSSGKISVSEGNELLSAVKTPRKSLWTLLTHPFDRLATVQALLLAACGSVAGLLLSRWHVRFDGALDVHITPFAVAFRQALIDQLIAWPLTAAVFWAISRAFSRHGRVIDQFAFVGVARLPLLAVGALAALMRNQLPTSPSEVVPAAPAVLLVLFAVTAPAMIWTVTLLFQGFRAAAGLRSGKTALPFIIAVVSAEVLSKVALHFLR